MSNKVLMKGNEVIAEAAIRAGCKCYFGYPITPQTEVLAYMANNIRKRGGEFVQAESELAAINMVYGAAGTGVRVMTSSSSPGISLMSEGISYLAASELPCVIVDVVRCGPGLGGIQPAQSDYNQVTKGLGHGDFNIPVYTPDSVQELGELVYESFDIADKYRTPVMVMIDGMLGQIMEPIEFSEKNKKENIDKSWCANGLGNRNHHNIINSLYLNTNKLEELNNRLQSRYKLIKENEARGKVYNYKENCDLILVAYGTTARICKTVIDEGELLGINLALIRPISIWPYPENLIEDTIINNKFGYLSVEMSCWQMVYDIERIVGKRKPVNFYGRSGGVVPTPEEILGKVKEIIGGNL